jgi:group II intron reverse transcriptase/maturase
MVVKRYLEPLVEPYFHPDSYGYRPGKSALDAVGAARQRCWRYDWVLDLDIQGFFDSIDTALLMRAVRKHTTCPWVLLYIERWLKAPVQMADGSLIVRDRGTPQGGVISPCLANLFLHYAFDMWMRRSHPDIPFERYADDAICHCRSEKQAKELRESIRDRFVDCGLTLHPEKTKVVYCKDEDRRGDHYRKDGHWYLGASPSKKSVQRLKQKVGAILVPGNQAPWPEVRDQLNSLLRGWSSYFSYGTRLMAYRAADNYVYHSVRRFLRRRHKVQSQGTRRFSDEAVYEEYGVLRLRRVHLGPMPTAAR